MGRLRDIDRRFEAATDGSRFARWGRWVTPAILVVIAIARVIGESRSGTNLAVSIVFAVLFVVAMVFAMRYGQRLGRSLRQARGRE